MLIEQMFYNEVEKMKSKRYENPNKVYVAVKVLYNEDGGFTPTAIIWEDGREFAIQKVLDVRQAASLKVGRVGDQIHLPDCRERSVPLL